MIENTSNQNTDQAIAAFYSQNSGFSLVGTNLYQNETLEALNWDGLDKENILEKLRALQRLSRLCNDNKVIQLLLDNGLDSAHRIASMTEDAFVNNYASVLNISADAARTIYQNAEDVKAKTMLLWANVKDVVASPHYNNLKVNNISQNITEFFEALPSYEELFGSLDYFEVDEAKSIFGAAAYYVDLMRIVDEFIAGGNNIPSDHTLEARRPDLRKILLTKENTNQTVPYLQIVNEVLVNAVKNYPQANNSATQSKEQDAEDVFKSFVTSKYPFNLPFNLPLEEIRTYLGQLNVKLSDIFNIFDMTEAQSIEYSREFLNMSSEEYDIITTPCADGISLGESFGYADNLITKDDGIDSFLNKTNLNLINVFKVKTALDDAAISALFSLDFSENELKNAPQLLSTCFINNVPGSAGNIEIVTNTDSNGVEYEQIINLDFNKLDRINRVIRLAQKLNWSFVDLDWVLTSMGNKEIENSTIINIAAIKTLIDKYKMPLKSLCSFWKDIRTIGEGNGDNSQVLFDVIFNDPDIVKKRPGAFIYHPKTSGNTDAMDNSSYNNPLYKDELLVWNLSQNSSQNDSNQELAKSIISSSIPVKANDVKALSEFLFGGTSTISLSIPNLSALYRHAAFSKLLGMKISEYIVLLTVLGKKAEKQFTVNDVMEISQTIDWMKKSKFNAYELDYIINGTQTPYVSKQFTDEKINQFISSLQLLMKPAYISEKSFVCPESNIDENMSTNIFKQLIEYGVISESGIVLLEDCNTLSFKYWNKFQYEQIFSNSSTDQADSVMNKLSTQKQEQEEKLATQLAVFLGTKKEIMSAIIEVGQNVLRKYGSNWVKIFADNNNVINLDAASPDIIKKIMDVAARYNILAQKLKLKETELESIIANHLSYNILNIESPTLENLKSLYEYKQLAAEFGDGLMDYFQAVNDAVSSDDVANYINKQLNDEKVAMFIASLNNIMEYLASDSFISNEAGIDDTLSAQLFNFMVDNGFVSEAGIVLVEDLDLNNFKIDYEVQYNKLLSIAPQVKADFAINKVLAGRNVQENIVLEQLAVFFNVSVELMSVLIKIASKIVIEYMENCAQLFADNGPAAGETVSVVIKKFMAVTSLYLVVARKLSLEPSQLDDLFLDNGVKDIENLRNIGLDNIVTPEGFQELVNKLRDKDGTHGYEGSFALVKDESLTEQMLQALNDVTGWDTLQIKELSNFFFEADTCITVADISKLKKCFDMGDNIGVDIYFLKDLYACKDLPSLTGSWDVFNQYARKILEAVKAQYSASAWTGVNTDLNSNIELKKRDRLLSAALWKINQLYSDIDNSSSLYKYLLLDVDMGAEAQISYIKQGLNSIQLYLHRCRMNLEKGVTTSNIPEVWWDWILSYRVWEANRKIFLYPENYLDPSLRNSKTSLFKGLEQTLMQSDITADSAEAAFKKYLDDFSELAKLRYVDSYYCTVDYPKTGEKDTLFLFARTQTAPYNYYFCTRKQDDIENGDEAAIWTEWQKIDISINAEYITPVYAFNRLFIFWVEMKQIKDSSDSSGKTITNKATIKYSFYNLSGNWIAPQNLVEDKVIHFDSDNYAESIKAAGAWNSPFDNQFNIDSVFWKKVYAMDVSSDNYGSDDPEGTAKAEKIAVMYGPFLLVTSSSGKLNIPYEPSSISRDDKSEYEGNIYSQALNYNRIMDFSEGGYLPLNDAMILNASLQKDFLLRSSEFLGIAMNQENCVFKPAIDRINNSLYVTSSDSIIHDNYIGENASNIVDTGEKTTLFSSIFSSNAKIITVKNQPGMFIYDNGDETFLLTPFKQGEDNKNLFNQIKQSYKLNLAQPILRGDSFISCIINEDTSGKIYQALVSKGIVDSVGKINSKFSSDSDDLLLAITLKDASLNLTEKQLNDVKQILTATLKGTALAKDSFESVDISIDSKLSGDILQVLQTQGLVDNQGYVTDKYDKTQAVTILSGCLKGDTVNLLDGQINIVKGVLDNAASSNTSSSTTTSSTTNSNATTSGTAITANSFVISVNKDIDATLSKNIFQKLVDVGVIDIQGNLADAFYDEKTLLIVSVSMLAAGIILSNTKLEIVKDTLLAASTSANINNIDPTTLKIWETWFPWILESLGCIVTNSFVTNIDAATSNQIFQCLQANGILDSQGKLNKSFTEDQLSSCLSAAPLCLHAGKIRAVGSILSKNMSKAEPDAFINSTINTQISSRIFTDLKINGILDSEGRICQNINKNIDLSNILSYLDTSQRSDVKKVLLDLFVPVMFDYDTGSEPIDFTNISFAVTRISTGAVDRLSGNLFSGGLDKLLSLESQEEPTERKLLFQRFMSTSIIDISKSFLVDGAQVDFNGPYGNYYWELFFHAPMMIAMRLHDNQKFSDAQKWFKYIFDPTIAPSNDVGLKYPESYHWQFLPFRGYTIESMVEMLQCKQEISVYNNEPFDPHAIARLRLGAYEKSVVMSCIDNLIDWGDYLFNQYTWESITEATMVYMYAYDLLGVKPRDLGSCKTEKPATFEDIHNKYQEDIPQFLIDLENVLSSSPSTGVPGTLKPINEIYAYFSVPGNRQFMTYWDTVEDRLFKIRHSLNIKGEKQLLALFEPELDPMQLARAAGMDNSLLAMSNYLQSAVPYYRFDYMLNKAKEVTSAVIQLGAALLSALEKNDAEAMAILSSTHEMNILNMTTMQKQKQIDEQFKNIEMLSENLNSAQNRYNTYKRYIDEGLNGFEIANQVLMGASIIPMTISCVLHGVAIAAYLVPDIFGLADGGMQFGDAVNAGSSIADGVAGILNQVAAMIDTNGQYARRRDDWNLEMKSAEYDVNQIQKSIEAAKIQADIARQDLAIHLKTIDQSQEMDSFLRSKFTNKDLYNWMIARVSTLYFQTYKLAINLSIQAQRAYQYETATNDSFINYGYWDSLKKGLLAGEGLLYSLQQMDKAYLDNNPRTLEIEKTVSLLQLDPLAFIEFKRTGQCMFNLDEELYDYDFPGHYRRQIKSVSISIPAVVGPYQNVNATLTQTSNSVILQPNGDAVEYMLKRGQDTSTRPEPDVLRENWVMNQKVAITKGIDDAGVFVLDFNDERYVPFEGTGSVSAWKLSMPHETNRINFDTISDIIINIKYKALDGGEAFASEVKEKLSSTGRKYIVYKYFDLKQEFSNAWYAFMNTNAVDGKQTLDFTIPNNVMLPNVQNASLQAVYFMLSTEDNVNITDNAGKGVFTNLTVKDTSISNAEVPFTKNLGIADEDQIKDVSGFTGEWLLEFDINKAPTQLISNGKLNADSLKDIQLVMIYEMDPFGN